jgi:hypothetical protein
VLGQDRLDGGPALGAAGAVAVPVPMDAAGVPEGLDGARAGHPVITPGR